MRKIAKEFVKSSLKIQRLWALAGSDDTSPEDRDAFVFGIRALEFSLKEERKWQFNDYLLNWPPELTPEQEARIKAIEDEMTDEERRIAGFED